jgi:signal transduction histidine kinase
MQPAGAPANSAAPASLRKLQILLVEDDPAFVDMIRGLLGLAKSFRFELSHAATLKQAFKRISQGKPDLILLDLNLPDSAGLSTPLRTHAEAPDLPIVILTGLDEQELAFQAVQEGAQDFLIKLDLDSRVLERSINYAIERHRLMAQVKSEYKKAVEHSRFKTQLVSMVSHEFANALSVIQCALPLLEESPEGKGAPQKKKLYQTIDKNVRALSVTAHNLLSLGRLEDGKFTLNLRKTEVAPIIQECLRWLELLYKRKSIRVIQEISKEPVAVHADPETLSLVISNLLSNAIKYTPKQGKITVGYGPDPSHPHHAQIFVQDTGIGIPRQEQEKIFTGYYRTEMGKKAAKGFGVGLAFAKTILEAHGSAIKVKSTPGRGSRFYFTLPLWSDEQPAAPPSPTPSPH